MGSSDPRQIDGIGGADPLTSKVATACTLPGSSGASKAVPPGDSRFVIERPTGAAEVLIEGDASGAVASAGTLRAARKLFEGRVFPRP